MNFSVPLGFSGVCAVIAAIFFVMEQGSIGGLFLAIGVIVVILSMIFSSRGGG